MTTDRRREAATAQTASVSIPVARLNHAVLYVRDADAGRRVLRPGVRLRGRRERIRRSGRVHARRRRATTTTTSACSRSGRMRPRPPRGSVGLYHLAWEVPTIDDLADGRPDPVGGTARSAAPRTTACSSRSTAPTRTATSSRSCGASRARRGANTSTRVP